MNARSPELAQRRQRIRRNVALLVGVALAFYFGFIYLVMTRAS